jgi:hypothetical protein
VPYWKEVATTLAVKYQRTERETAHLLALINMVAFDGLVASHEAKFFYWLLRPTMADLGITLAIPLNFPSYPSNHAVLSSGIARDSRCELPGRAGSTGRTGAGGGDLPDLRGDSLPLRC